MNHWTVRCRAVAFDGSPDKFIAVIISGKLARTATEAVWVAQTHRDHIFWERCPNRALVDWHATNGTEAWPDQPTADDWRRLCVMLLLQHGRTTDVSDVTLTQADDLDSYTVAWSRNPTSFSWQLRAYRDPDGFDKAPDRPLGGPDVSLIVAARAAVLERLEPFYRQRLLESPSLDDLLEEVAPGSTRPVEPRKAVVNRDQED